MHARVLGALRRGVSLENTDPGPEKKKIKAKIKLPFQIDSPRTRSLNFYWFYPYAANEIKGTYFSEINSL